MTVVEVTMHHVEHMFRLVGIVLKLDVAAHLSDRICSPVTPLRSMRIYRIWKDLYVV